MSSHVLRPGCRLMMLCIAGLLALPACSGSDDESTDAILIVDSDEGQVSMTQDMAMGDMGTSEDMDEDAPDLDAPEDPMFACEGSQLSGTVYLDVNLSSTSRFLQKIDDEDVTLVGEDLILIGEEATLRGKTCAQGTYGVGGLKDGLYILGATTTEGRTSSSSSQGMRFIDAVQEGQLEVVVFGDSIPTFGPRPWYPNLLEQTLDKFADTEVINIAKVGTQSVDWLPGQGGYFESTLLPRLRTADVIVFSLGGNDLYDFANSNMDLSSPEKVGEALEQIDAVIAQIIDNLKVLITSMRQYNADADIVWMLYPNYATSDQWAALAPDYIDLIARVLRGKLNGIRKDLAHHEGLIMWDMLKSTDNLDLDGYLVDPLHLNVAGHVWWSRELFMTLGGVIIENGARVDAHISRDIGLGTR